MMWRLPGDGWYPQGSRPPHPEIDDDVRLTFEVADALLADERTRRLRVTVEAQDRVVLLGGTVHDQRTAEVAATVVRQVPGVRDVCNTVRTRARGSLDAGDDAPATGGRRESESFDEIVASLSTPDGAAGRPATAPRRSSGRARLFRMAVLLLLLGWLVLELGWPGVLIACGVGAGMVEMYARRRKSRK